MTRRARLRAELAEKARRVGSGAIRLRLLRPVGTRRLEKTLLRRVHLEHVIHFCVRYRQETSTAAQDGSQGRKTMPTKTERQIDELYADDPERADAVVFGRRTDVSRRGFLGGAGLAAMSAAVGGPIVFAATMPGGLIPAALAQEAKKDAPARRRPKVRSCCSFPARTAPGRARRQAAGGGDARAPARRRHDADVQVLHPQQRPDPRGDRGAGRVEAHHRRRGQQAARAHARRAEEALQPRPIAWCSNAAATAARSSRRRRAATSGPTAASAAPNGRACRSPTCSRRPA